MNERFVYICVIGDIGYLSESVKCKESILFRHTPSSYNYSWHNAPRRYNTLYNVFQAGIIYDPLYDAEMCQYVPIDGQLLHTCPRTLFGFHLSLHLCVGIIVCGRKA